MPEPQMVMFAEEFHQIQGIVDSLVKSSNASVVFIIDKNGQLIAASGESDNIDTTSLASLTAGNIAATGGMAKLLREREFFPREFSHRRRDERVVDVWTSRERDAPVCHCTIWIDRCRFLKRTDSGGVIEAVQ